MGLTVRRQTGQNKKKIREVDPRTGQRNIKLYSDRKKTKIRGIKMKEVRRTIRQEDKARNTRKLVQECIKDLEKERPKGEKDKWERKKRELLERTGKQIWSVVVFNLKCSIRYNRDKRIVTS